MAYVLLPPASGVLLLILEHKSDYVRYFYPTFLSALMKYGAWVLIWGVGFMRGRVRFCLLS